MLTSPGTALSASALKRFPVLEVINWLDIDVGSISTVALKAVGFGGPEVGSP
jgi:hypothetical protein